MDWLKGKSKEAAEMSYCACQKPTVRPGSLKLRVSGEAFQKGWGC